MIAQRIVVVSRTVALAREVQAAAGSGCAVVHHDRVTDLDEMLVAEGPFDVMVAGPLADSRSALSRLARARAAHPAMAIVLAMANPPRSPLSEVVRVGAVDYLELPSEPRLMRSVIRRALDIEAPPALSAVAQPIMQPAPLAEVLTIASPSGGCGKTFYSTNLAHFLHVTTRQRVCLVDLDLQFGEVSSALRLKPRYTMTDAVTRSDLDEEDLEEHIEDYLLTHSGGFWVLPAPRNPAEADQITPPDVTKVISALRRRFDYLVLDTSAQLSEIVLAAMDQSTALYCMATLDLPSIRNMRVFLDTLEKLKVPTDSVSVILNKVESDMGIRVEEANEALHSKIVSVLPYAREVSRSINEGMPVLMSAPKSAISTRLAADLWSRLPGLAGDGSTGANGAARAPLAPAEGQRQPKPGKAAGPRQSVLKRLLKRSARKGPEPAPTPLPVPAPPVGSALLGDEVA